MANFTLVADSTFKPFTYQELVTPIAHQQQVMDQLADEYDKLSSQADILEAMGKNDKDKKSGVYSQYQAYSNALREEADNLYRNGLNYDSRMRLSDLRRRYNKEIVPIQNAWNEREQEAQLQRKAMLEAAARGIDIRFSREAANSSLDSYLQNPNQGFQVINGQQITSEVANQFKGLANQVQSDGKGNYFIKGKALSPIEYSIITQKGMDWNQYQDFINNPNDPRFDNIRGIIENTLNAHGIKNFDANTYRDMFAYGAQGVAAGVGARDVQLHTDAYAKDMLNFRQQIALQDRAHQNAIALAKAKGEIPDGNGDGNRNKGLPGETAPINFNDPESAGLNMKRRLAQATADYLTKHPNNPNAKKIMDYWKNRGGLEAAKKHWETNGFNGDEKWVGKGKDNIYYDLGNYLRNNVTKNENIINIWRSGYAKKAKAPQGKDSASSYRKNTYMGLDMYGNQITESTYASTKRVPGKGTIKAVKPGTKDWKDFDKLASNGYQVKAVDLADKPEALEKFLDRTLSRNTRNGVVKLYDIKKISGDNKYTYSDSGTKIEDLPHTSTGAVDYKKMHRMMLSNGDYLLYWVNDKGTSVQKVLRRSDIGEQSVRDWNRTSPAYKDALEMYTEGTLSAEDFSSIARMLRETNMANSYLETQEVDVEDYKLK